MILIDSKQKDMLVTTQTETDWRCKMTTLTYDTTVSRKSADASSMFSQPNVGGLDRLFRVGLASVLLIDGLHGTGPLGLESVMFLIAIPLIVSAIIARDPFYALLKIRSATLHDADPHALKAETKMNPNGGINVGTLDRVFRVFAAGLLLATPFLWTEAIGAGAVVGTVAGIIVMMTAIMGWDPMYRLAKIRTTTVKTGTAKQQEYNRPVDTFELFDDVQGDATDIYKKAA